MMKTRRIFTSQEFNRTAIGRTIANSGLVDALATGGGGIYDDYKPFLVHEVQPPSSALGGCYYSLHGFRVINDAVVFAKITLANGSFNDAKEQVDTRGNSSDRIDIQFEIRLDPPQGVKVSDINKFCCTAAEPDDDAGVDALLREAEDYIARMERGEFVNFQRSKIKAWSSSERRAEVVDVLAESWARSRRGLPEPETFTTRRMQARGLNYMNRTYSAAPKP
jgi:hypothetical protein